MCALNSAGLGFFFFVSLSITWFFSPHSSGSSCEFLRFFLAFFLQDTVYVFLILLLCHLVTDRLPLVCCSRKQKTHIYKAIWLPPASKLARGLQHWGWNPIQFKFSLISIHLCSNLTLRPSLQQTLTVKHGKSLSATEHLFFHISSPLVF